MTNTFQKGIWKVRGVVEHFLFAWPICACIKFITHKMQSSGSDIIIIMSNLDVGQSVVDRKTHCGHPAIVFSIILYFSTSRVHSSMSVGDTTAMDVEFPDEVMLAAGDEAMERLSQQENRERLNQQENQAQLGKAYDFESFLCAWQMNGQPLFHTLFIISRMHRHVCRSIFIMKQ